MITLVLDPRTAVVLSKLLNERLDQWASDDYYGMPRDKTLTNAERIKIAGLSDILNTALEVK